MNKSLRINDLPWGKPRQEWSEQQDRSLNDENPNITLAMQDVFFRYQIIETLLNNLEGLSYSPCGGEHERHPSTWVCTAFRGGKRVLGCRHFGETEAYMDLLGALGIANFFGWQDAGQLLSSNKKAEASDSKIKALFKSGQTISNSETRSTFQDEREYAEERASLIRELVSFLRRID